MRRQVVQPLFGGAVQVLDVPRPSIDPTEVLISRASSRAARRSSASSSVYGRFQEVPRRLGRSSVVPFVV